MFRGFEIILAGEGPPGRADHDPRICGICGGSHLTKACYALDTAWKTVLPPNATLVRNIAQACETLQSIPRWFYAIFAIDLVNKKYARATGYDEALRRFAPFVGESYEPGVVLGAKPVEVYAIFGGQWPHSSFMIPGGVMCAPTLTDITRSIAILDYFRQEWIENQLLAVRSSGTGRSRPGSSCSSGATRTSRSTTATSPFSSGTPWRSGSTPTAGATATTWRWGRSSSPASTPPPTIEGRSHGLITRAGVYAEGRYHGFDHLRVSEDVTHSYFKGTDSLHPWDGVTEPIDPADGKAQGKYTWAKAPRYDVEGLGHVPLEVGPLARQMIAGNPEREAWQSYDPLIKDIHDRSVRASWCAHWPACTRLLGTTT